MRRLTLLVAMLLAPFPAGAQPALSPGWGSDQIRAARPTGAEDALIFDVTEEQKGAPKPTPATTSTVTLTATTVQIASGGRHSIDDLSLCRSLAWSDDRPVLQNVSCYADPGFRAIELGSRMALTAASAAANIAEQAELSDPYWSEANLGMQQAPTDRLTKAQTGDATAYRLKDVVVVRMIGSAAILRGDEPAWVARYFARHWPLHPQPRRDLRGGTILPARIEFDVRDIGNNHTEVLTISRVRRGKAAYALPPKLTSWLRVPPGDGDPAMQRGITQALLAIDGQAPTPKPSPDSLVARIHTAAAQGRPLEELLLFANISLQYLPWMTAPAQQGTLAALRPLLREASKDPETAMLIQSQALAGNAQAPGDRQAIAWFLARTTKLDEMPFGTIRFVTFANLVRQSRDASTWDPAIFKLMPANIMDDYWIHIAAYPWAAGPYFDLGNNYLLGYDTPHAWLAFDLGRAVDPDSQTGLMANVNAREKQLRLTQPDYF